MYLMQRAGRWRTSICHGEGAFANETVSLRTTLITKLLTNPLAQWQSTADVGARLPVSGRVSHTDRLSMAWKRSGVRVP